MAKTKNFASKETRQLVVIYRLFFALLTVSAILVQIQKNVDDGNFNPANFFSFFTIQSNILITITFIIGAVLLAKNKVTKGFDLLRGAAALYMTITGIVFAILLSGIQQELQTTIPWVNTVLHYIMPIVAVADWLVVRPVQIRYKTALIWVTLPIIYLPYSLVRGEITGWYPYPFLDPGKSGGYIGVFGYAICITAVTLGLIWLLTRVERKE